MTVTVDDIRLLTGLSTDEISDSDLSGIIDKAWLRMMPDVTALVDRKLAKLTSTNYIIEDARGYIFDVNNDGSIDYSDVTIYYFDSDGVEHQIDTAFTYYPLQNRLEFSSALDTSHQYYIRYREIWVRDSDIIEEAHLWLSAYLAAVRIWGMTPEMVRLGRSGWTSRQPGQLYLDNYRRIVASLKRLGEAIEYGSHISILSDTI